MGLEVQRAVGSRLGQVLVVDDKAEVRKLIGLNLAEAQRDRSHSVFSDAIPVGAGGGADRVPGCRTGRVLDEARRERLSRQAGAARRAPEGGQAVSGAARDFPRFVTRWKRPERGGERPCPCSGIGTCKAPTK